MKENRTRSLCAGECGEVREIVSRGLCVNCYNKQRRRDRKEAETAAPIPGLDTSQHREHDIIAKTRIAFAGILAALTRMDRDAVNNKVISHKRREVIRLWCHEAIAKCAELQPADLTEFDEGEVNELTKKPGVNAITNKIVPFQPEREEEEPEEEEPEEG